MSRLIVKNLPAYLTPDRLRQHFEQVGNPGGTITDVKVSLKPDGTSRRFGFVGFKTDKEATAAKEWFDRTFIDSTRINVAVVQGAKDAPAPRPNKRRRLESDPVNNSGPSSQAKGNKLRNRDKSPLQDEHKPPSQLDTFMKVMQPRTKKGPSWANEAEESHPTPIPVPNDTPVEAEPELHPEQDGEEISDLEWMRRRMKQQTISSSDPEKAFHQSDGKQDDTSAKAQPEEKDPVKDTIMQTSRLFLRNLAFSCTEAELLELFQPFGDIAQVHLPLDSLSKQPKGLAYVTFAQPASALSAYEALDKKSFQGRLLHILPAVDRKGKVQLEDGDAKKTLKDERNAKRKATAGREFNWSMLYMNSDAVASSIADRMNIAKADILNPESDNAAVKLALAETHVIQETKSYLESQGVVLASFSSRARSDTTILVKNIPYGTTAEQIRELFETHGQLSRVIVPPAGTMAVVEFVHSDEASKAFRAVAYRRLGNSVVYLEKGPLGMFLDAGESNHGPSTLSAAKPITIAEQATPDGAAAEQEPAMSAGSTLFVKNLAFSTTTERLTQVFRNLPSFSFARVQTKPDPKRPAAPGVEAPRLSMGYGFVGFKTADGAKKALKSMQGYVLDGHALHVKFAGRGTEEDEPKDKTLAKSRSTKMIVKNVPFEATKKDIRELFGAHGHLKSVRLPKKFDARSRGFAFLDFLTRHEAENAYAALRHTHLLGRHLVLEWAEEAEQDLDVLRKKAGVGYGGGGDLPGRKRKLDLGGDDDGGDGEE
ncbi:RNA-binding domain-containing protein [Leucogyrophana mollusca]|uniref:RNA-binding domain-containing protein n=1 Tax=Leucogyrophana mollusca TaxID=85980 RepID=A0ACB8BGQ3_9AGAM|nr:RNA-binding domain-containing protein [Leucogyrophana mollusca]